GHPRWSRPDDPGWQGRLRGSPPLPLRGERRGAEEDARTAAAAPRVARDDRSATGWAGGSGKRRRLGRCTVSPTFRRLALFVLPAWLLAGCATTYLNRAPPSPSEPVVPASAGGDRAAAQGSTPIGPPPGDVADDGSTIKPGAQYGLPELVELAAASNPDTRIVWQKARQAALAVGVAHARDYPTLSAVALGGYQH